jgi:WD40 repeat protein
MTMTATATKRVIQLLGTLCCVAAATWVVWRWHQADDRPLEIAAPAKVVNEPKAMNEPEAIKEPPSLRTALKRRIGQSFRHVAFSPDGNTLAALNGREIILWNVASGNETILKKAGDEEFTAMAFTPDSKQLAVASRDFQPMRFLDSNGHYEPLPNSKKLKYGWITLYEAASGKYSSTEDKSYSASLALLVMPDGKTCAFGGESNTINFKQFSFNSERRGPEFVGLHDNWVLALAITRDGKLMASGSNNRTIKLWDVDKRQEIRTLTGHGGAVTCLALSPDGKTLASGSGSSFEKEGKWYYSGEIRIWDVTSGVNKITLNQKHHVNALAFSPDGETLAWGGGYMESENGNWLHPCGVKLWDLASGKEIPAFQRENLTEVWSLAFNPDGKTLAAVTSGTIGVLDIPVVERQGQ